jgi:hypothetical protein
MRRRDVGRGRRLRPVERIHRAREAESRFGGPRVLGPPPSDPTAPYYGGAAVKAGSGSGEGRTRLTREGRKLDRRQVRNGDPTADKSGGSRPIERRTFRSDPDAGSKGEARKGGAGASRGDAERLQN